MKKALFIVLILVLALAMNVSAQVSRLTNFTATANVEGSVSFSVVLNNTISPTALNFGTIQANNIPVIASNAGQPSYAAITYNHNYPLWEVKVYTDNTSPTANPQYVGTGNQLYGNIDDGTGLVLTGNATNRTHSSPIKVWCNTKFPNGSYAKAPCLWWKGTATGFYGVPKPANETALYWVDQDINGGGIAAITNQGAFEATYGFDANGDGDTVDIIGTSGTNASINNLGSVFEYSYWMPVTADKDVYTGANTPVLIDDALAYGVTSGTINAYFGVTDDVFGALQTSKLIFEFQTK